MSAVTSKDGPSIAYERMGSGPAVVLVGGGIDDGSENVPLLPELARRFTVINCARRGLGDRQAGGLRGPVQRRRRLAAKLA